MRPNLKSLSVNPTLYGKLIMIAGIILTIRFIFETFYYEYLPIVTYYLIGDSFKDLLTGQYFFKKIEEFFILFYLIGLLGLVRIIGFTNGLIFVLMSGIVYDVFLALDHSFFGMSYELHYMIKLLLQCGFAVSLLYLFFYLVQYRIWSRKGRFSLLAVTLYPLITIIPVLLYPSIRKLYPFYDFGVVYGYWGIAWFFFGYTLMQEVKKQDIRKEVSFSAEQVSNTR